MECFELLIGVIQSWIWQKHGLGCRPQWCTTFSIVTFADLKAMVVLYAVSGKCVVIGRHLTDMALHQFGFINIWK